MRILLVGEYSRLHNSLKEGLIRLGHEVKIVGNGDSFKKYPVDFNIEAYWSQTKIINIFRQIIFRLFRFDFAKTERGLRFWKCLKHFKSYDVVQFINEAPIKTTPKFELFLMKKLLNQNQKMFLLSSGIDRNNVEFLLKKPLKYSLLDPYFENPGFKNQYQYIFDYLKPSHKKLSTFIYENTIGIIASDIDYVLPLHNDSKFLGLIPNPVNLEKIQYEPIEIKDKICIFLGINTWNSTQKGIVFFEKALKIIESKYPDKVEILITKNLPYQEYINIYNRCHILLDNVFGYDQGYNALEAMAKGKVVFTGAEEEFVQYYNLKERVNVNALPDVEYLVKELSFLIENPEEIRKTGERARAFIEKEHDHIKIAEKYLETWLSN